MLAAIVAGCHSGPTAPPAPPAPKIRLSVMPIESAKFPRAAKAVNDALADAHVTGVDETAMSKVSLEVVQLQIECDDLTPECYQAAGKAILADRLLFAQIAPGKKKQVDVTVTLFDVDGSTVQHAAHDVFANETAAVAGVGKLVSEATAP